ncbi:MAG TPA: hypothetical protein PLC12_05020, partial [Candidatus Methanofastidiosa archaeon]|nr:hypothetical protein [Candidatus Methanofastidiosa archaeon]
MKMPSLLGNLRILLWAIILVAAIVSINPSFSDGFDTDLQFGIEIEGGSWINLELEGNLVQATGDTATMVEYLIESKAGVDITFVQYSDDIFTFSFDDLETYQSDIDNSITWTSTTSFDLDTGIFTLEADNESVMAVLLQYINNGCQVTLVEFDGDEWFEVRRSLSEEEETLADELSSDEFESYLHGWYNEQLDGVATVTNLLNRVSPDTTNDSRDIISTKLNYLGLSDIPVKTTDNDRYISVEFAGVDLGEAESLVTEQGKFEIKVLVEAAEDIGDEDVYALIVAGDEIESVDHYSKDISTQKWYVPFSLTGDG